MKHSNLSLSRLSSIEFYFLCNYVIQTHGLKVFLTRNLTISFGIRRVCLFFAARLKPLQISQC